MLIATTHRPIIRKIGTPRKNKAVIPIEINQTQVELSIIYPISQFTHLYLSLHSVLGVASLLKIIVYLLTNFEEL